MFNDPDVGETITVDGRTYRFIQVPDAPGIVYAELGKKAKVYRVVQGSKAYALKVFKPLYRTPKIIRNSDLISAYCTVPGMSVADRTIFSTDAYPQLIAAHPEFPYAILMPWIEGKSWGNFIAKKTAISSNESLRLAKAFADTIYGLEKRNIAHCDLSGGNFIFSDDFNKVELVDIEEMYGIDFQKPDPTPAGTSGYSPDWVKKQGLWDANADRFAAGILICEILGWRFEDVRNATSTGDSFFADGELCQDSKRYRLLENRLGEIHPQLAELLQTVWRAQDASKCPKILEWERLLGQLSENSSITNWEWEPLGLPIGIDISEKVGKQPAMLSGNTVKIPVEKTTHDDTVPVKAHKESQTVVKTNAFPQEEKTQSVKVITQPWPEKGNSRGGMLSRIFSVFAVVGIVMFLLILGSGSSIDLISRSLQKSGGMFFVDMMTNAILGLAVGGVHAWIFRNNIRKSTMPIFILSSVIGGAIGGAIAGLLTDLDSISDPIAAGAVIGSVAGSISSLGQNLFMRSQGMQSKWFLFNLLSWPIIWIMGISITWSNHSIPSIASGAALIIISSGASLSLFLHKFPEVEF